MWRTWYDTDSGSLVIEAVVRFCIVVSSLLALNRNISLRVTGDWWQQGSWSDDNMTKPRKSLPRTWCCLAPSSSLSSQFCLYFVSSYLATQYLGRILSWPAPAPFSNVDADTDHLTDPLKTLDTQHTRMDPFFKYKESFTSHILSANAMVRWAPQCIEFSATARH